MKRRKLIERMDIWDKVGYKIIFIMKMFKYRIVYGRAFSTGKSFSFRKRFTVNVNQGGRLTIGSHVFFNSDCSINCKQEVIIGDYCIFGENVKIYDHNHRFLDYSKPIIEQGYSVRSIHIGNNCWIGSNVVILPGSIVGSNSIIGAGSVISGEIPEGVIVTANRELHYVKRRRDER